MVNSHILLYKIQLCHWLSRKMPIRRICEIDGKEFSGKNAIYSHNKIHLNEEFECFMCDKMFKTEEYLHQHKKAVHIGQDIWYLKIEHAGENIHCKYNRLERKHLNQKHRGRRFFLVIRDNLEEMRTDKRFFKKKNRVRRKL